MNKNRVLQNSEKRRFILTRKNQNGQVALFVALIFQVVFVFFALLINVGLLVHHKINLQQSTDIAAYYGAMKQAEQMNAIAHINFQMRQAWKLFTWRYRIAGTFGFIAAHDNPTAPGMPFESVLGNHFQWNGTGGAIASPTKPYDNGTDATRCSMLDSSFNVDAGSGPSVRVGFQDIPFFCIGHHGFKSWPSGENNCQINCSMLSTARVIQHITPLTSTYVTPDGGSMAPAVQNALNLVESDLTKKCTDLGPTGAVILGKFMAALAAESTARSETIKMLAANLSQDADSIVDLDGKKIKDGALRTLQNNLTGANFSGFNKATDFTAINGLNANNCRFKNGSNDGQTEFLKRIEFKFINLFIHNCKNTGAGHSYQPEPVYQSNNILSSAFTSDPAIVDNNLQQLILSFLHPDHLATVGYEKNPNCVEYYAVKASSEPNIPFLPLSKIKLQAVAVAKPFGGSIGPWYGTSWPLNESRSKAFDSDLNSRIDSTLPMRDFTGDETNPQISHSVYSQPNFALFVGDKLGLRNLDYIASYHAILATRGVKGTTNLNTTGTIDNNGSWPDFDNWKGIENSTAGSMIQYDSVAKDPFLRQVEISAIAPNQFDIFHYSIDPDFYNNYYVKLVKNFNDIKNGSHSSVTIDATNIRADFGAVNMDGNVSSDAPLTEKSFSVKDQILMKNNILDYSPNPGPSYPPLGSDGNNTYNSFLNFLVGIQSSLLTGWTFLRFGDYVSFPNHDVSVSKIVSSQYTMSFGQCSNAWNNTSHAINNKMSPDDFKSPPTLNVTDNPPVPGNCVTGGRTGYSVKLITPSMVSNSGEILNALDPGFLKF
ncbi:MAG: Tad domain-containing protein [Pseudobdellovibrio sp.]